MEDRLYRPGESYDYQLTIKTGKPIPLAQLEVVDLEGSFLPHDGVSTGEGKLSKYAVPDIYEIVDEIPKTSVGKLDKKVLRKLYARHK